MSTKANWRNNPSCIKSREEWAAMGRKGGQTMRYTRSPDYVRGYRSGFRAGRRAMQRVPQRGYDTPETDGSSA